MDFLSDPSHRVLTFFMNETACLKTCKIFPPTFFERIKRQRKALGWTLEEVERLTGISKKTLIRLEHGEDVRLSTLAAVLNLLDIYLTIDPEKTIEPPVINKSKRRQKCELTDEQKDGWF